MRQLILMFVVLAIVSGCNVVDSNIGEIDIFAYKTMNKFGDSTYFSDIASVQAYGNSFYFSDYVNSRIVKTDKDLNFIKSIGHYGEGPGEFIGASELFIRGPNLYVFDDGNNKLHLLKNDEWIKSIKIPSYGPFLERFFVSNEEHVFYSFFDYLSHIYIIDTIGNVLADNVINRESFWNNEELVRSSCHLFETGDSTYLVIPIDEPVIYLYNKNDNIVSQNDISEISLLKEPISVLRDENLISSKNTINILFYDAYFDNGSLYLLNLSILNKEEKCFNSILKFNVNEKTIDFVNSYRLHSNSNGSWYNSIAVCNDTLVAFEFQTSEIQLFHLK